MQGIRLKEMTSLVKNPLEPHGYSVGKARHVGMELTEP